MSKTRSQRDGLERLVKLYRALAYPEIEEGDYLDAHVESADTPLLELVHSADSVYREKFEKLQLDGVDLNESWDVEQYQSPILDLTILLPPNLFYSNLKDFVETSTQLSMGILRNDYFLVDENYFAGEDDAPQKIEQLEKICAWIIFLQKVLPYTERRPSWLTFVIFPEPKEENNRSKITFRSKISYADLDLDLSKSSEFLGIAQKDDLHASERMSVFRQALAEMLGHHPDEEGAFSYILGNMDKLYRNYHDNYERYINGFSIEKLQKEVIDDYNRFSAQIRVALNEIISKAFAVPASLAAAALLVRLDNPSSDIILTLVVLLTTIITEMSLSWQSNHIRQIRDQISTKFESFLNSGASGAEFANKREVELETSAKSVGHRIFGLRLLSGLPVILVGIYLWGKYPNAKVILEELIEWLSGCLDSVFLFFL